MIIKVVFDWVLWWIKVTSNMLNTSLDIFMEEVSGGFKPLKLLYGLL